MRCSSYPFKDSANDLSPEAEAFVRSCFASAPGVISVRSVQPYHRGGFEVIFNRQEELHDDFDDYIKRFRLMAVI
jgi:hypothetical protein